MSLSKSPSCPKNDKFWPNKVLYSYLFYAMSKFNTQGVYWIFEDCKTNCFKSDADDYFLETNIQLILLNLLLKKLEPWFILSSSFHLKLQFFLCCKGFLSARSEPMILCRNVIKVVKYDLCFKYVEGVLTNRLNLLNFFIFLDFFPPTVRIWNFWLARHIFLTCSKIEMLELKKYLVLFSPFKSVSFFFFSIFLTLVTLYFEVVQHIYMECIKFDKKALIRFHWISLNTWVKCWWWICFLIRLNKFWNRWTIPSL